MAVVTAMAQVPPAPGDPVAPPRAATAGPAAEEMIPAGQINFVAADLNNVLTIYSELVGRTILRPANLGAPQIVLKTQTPLTKSEAIQALDAVLALNGIAMLNVGDKFVKAVPVAQANQEAKAFDDRAAEDLPEFGQYTTHVVQTRFIKPTELAPVLQQFAKIPNSILSVDSSQILVLRDYAENVKRMLEMIAKVDVAVPSEFISEVIPIKYALASDIASAISSLGGGGSGGSVGQRSTGTRTGTTRPGGTGASGANPYGGTQPGMSPGAMGAPGTPGAAGGSSFSDRLQQIIKRAATPTGDLQLLGYTKIIADERMNALLIFATREDMKMIKDIVEKLDVVLAQVLIETIIMDVGLEDRFDFGVSGVQTPRDFSGDFTGAGGANANKFFNFAGSGNTNAAGDLLGSGLRYFGRINDDIFISLEAMASDGRASVIQKPRIQTSHATPAAIFIGETVPYVTSTYFGGGFGGGPSSSFSQLRVGIGLNVTPFINPDGLVVMQIDQTIDEISGATPIEGVGNVPNTTSRTLSAEIAVLDNESILLGGFIRNADSTTKSGVPFLKDIPLLGYLFRSTSEQKKRTELMVLMRPTVLRTPELAAMQVDIEKARLPGVIEAERRVKEYEDQAAAQAARGRDPKGFKETRPFTDAEMKLFGTPPPN